jgi:hypothetical protein
MAERVRIEIGFAGGQALTIVVDENAADDLQREIGGEGAITLEAEDGRYTVALRRVAYLRRFAREARVGFGSG